MKKLLYFLSLLFTIHDTHAQNLVNNGNFETYTACPTNHSLITNCTGWRHFNAGSSDFFHTCGTNGANVPNTVAGFQLPASGNAFAGGAAFTTPTSTTSTYKELIAGYLISPLQVGVPYEVSMSVNVSNNSGYGTDDLGVFFYDNGPNTYAVSMPPVTPQVTYTSYGPIIDTQNWVRISAIYYPDSAYDNIVIGSWKQAALAGKMSTGITWSTSYYYFDSIVVKEIITIKITYADTMLCAGDQVNIPYIVSPNLYFNSGNIFKLELSDAAGSFANPTILASQPGIISGSLTAVIPNTLIPGNGYRMRITGSNPQTISNISQNPLSIGITNPGKPIIATNTACTGQQLNFNTPNNLPGVTYTWTGPGSFTSTSQNPVISNTTPAAAGDYIVAARLYGCVSKDTHTVVVNTIPAVPLVTANNPVCPGTTLYLTSTGTAGSNYSWTGPNSFSSASQNPAVNNIGYINAGVYSVAATLNGCTSATGTANVTVAITTATPQATSNSPICTGCILNLSASAISGATYNWTKTASTFSSSQQNPVIDPAVITDAGDYIVTATINGCISLPDTITVLINSVTYLGAYASPNDTICIGKPLSVVTVPVNGGISPSFQWFNNSGPITGATNVVYNTNTAVTGDSFYCRMIAGNVCNTPLTLFSNKIGITVLPQDPSSSVTISSVPANPLPGNAVTFTAIVTNGGTDPQYQWLRNGQHIVGAVSNTWSANNLHPNDIISVKVTSGNPCPADSFATSNTVEVRFPTSVNRANNNSGFYLYPNPNNGSFRLEGNIGINTPSSFQVLNVLGQVVYRGIASPINSHIAETIQLHNAAKGMYLLRINITDGDITQRFFVQ